MLDCLLAKSKNLPKNIAWVRPTKKQFDDTKFKLTFTFEIDIFQMMIQADE